MTYGLDTIYMVKLASIYQNLANGRGGSFLSDDIKDPSMSTQPSLPFDDPARQPQTARPSWSDGRVDPAPIAVTVQLTADDVERIARRAAEILTSRTAASPRRSSPYLTIPEAAELLQTKRQRIDDLLSQGRLTRVKDGGRTLIAVEELERYLQGTSLSRPRADRRSAA